MGVCKSRSILVLAVVSLSVITAAAGPAQELPPGDSPPPTVFDRIEDAGVAEDHEGADHIIVYDRTLNRVKSTGVTYTDENGPDEFGFYGDGTFKTGGIDNDGGFVQYVSRLGKAEHGRQRIHRRPAPLRAVGCG